MTKHPSTLGSTDSSAQICRDRGWKAGTLLVDPATAEMVQISAVGVNEVLAVSGNTAEEFLFDLRLREWIKL